MAQQLWFLRHAEAEPHDARGDFERRLTARGEDQSRAAGRALAALELTFQLALTSPKVRARDTARLACAPLDCEPLEHAPLSDGFDVDDALELVAAGADRILLVGHNPDLAVVVHDLTGARLKLKKGGVAAVRMDGRRGDLVTLLRPRELDRIG
ncbi:MAG: histidine phosphatase family protein [Actinomycetota bacterium]|nr:histidine phosphatase family protein [Actinomycetota bacterium]